MFRVLATIRTPVLMFIVVPLSFARWAFRSVREIYRTKTRSQNKEDIAAGHEQRILSVIQQIQEWNKRGRPKPLRTARPNWAAMSTKLSSNKEACELISVTHLNHILNINKDKMEITCEPMVTMGQLTQQLLPLGLALKCQVEMESLSIGGLSLGFGLETNSHTNGFFQETVVGYKIVTSNAQIINVTPTSDPELFYAIPWSHGSLGFLLSVTVQLIPVEAYVKITYIPTYSAQELYQKLKMYSESEGPTSPTFVEATIYTSEKAVIQLGEFVPSPPPGKFHGINYFWKPFYYKHVETFLQKGESWEVVPIKHFYHRFTRSIFWELEDMIPFSNHPLYRLLWGWMGAPEVSLLKLFQGPVVRRSSVYAHVVQESIMPIDRLPEGIEKFDNWYGVYPLLVFPIRIYDRGEGSGFLTPRKENLIPGKDWGIWVDLGAYGAPRAVKQGKNWDPKINIREMEHWTRDIGGWQAPYTDLFCTKKEFRQMFNHTLYDQQRLKYNAIGAFPEVFDKIKPEAGIVDLAEELAKEAQAEK
jgi:delta24-sterol reductase